MRLRTHSINWSGASSNTYNSSSRRDSNIDPYFRTSSSTYRTSSSRYGDRSGYPSYGDRDSSRYSDYRSGTRDAVAGASRYDFDRERRRDDHGRISSRDHESSYSRFARERAERDRSYNGYGGSGEGRRSSNYERDREHATQRGATAGFERTGSTYRYGAEHGSTSRHSRRDSQGQASCGARQEERSGSVATSWPGNRRSSAQERFAFSPSEYYKYW